MLIAEGFLLFSILLFLARMLSYNSNGYRWVIVDVLSGLFILIAAYFFTFSPLSTYTGTYNQSGTVTNLNLTISEPQVTVSSQGFILLWVIVFFYIMLMVIFALRDFLAARYENKI